MLDYFLVKVVIGGRSYAQKIIFGLLATNLRNV